MTILINSLNKGLKLNIAIGNLYIQFSGTPDLSAIFNVLWNENLFYETKTFLFENLDLFGNPVVTLGGVCPLNTLFHGGLCLSHPEPSL